MAIHGFGFLKFAKPAHEHHQQVFPNLSQAWFSALYGLKS
jgi:hypothetical protein